jgi:anti-sigma regulatory factor (Ser/Thr protein kinase)
MTRAVTTVELSFPASSTAVGAARRSLSQHPALAEDLRRDLALVASEVVANAVLHGACAPDGAVRIRAEYRTRSVRITVRDGGAGFDPVTAPRREEGGFGLRIVDTLAKRWGVAPGSVWFELASPAG